MNRKLKVAIIEKFGSQADFSMVIEDDESVISRVIRGRRRLSADKQKIWADALGCKRDDLFPQVNQGA